MIHRIETRQEQNGTWVAWVHSVPGLQVYGLSEAETRTVAEKLAAIIMDRKGNENRTRILAFYLRAMPDSAQAASQPPDGPAELPQADERPNKPASLELEP
jgi:hypothetical protein